MISTQYTPPNGLPAISLTVKEGKLLLLDWYNDKTAKLFDQINQNSAFIEPSNLDPDNFDQKIAQQTISELTEYFLGKRQTFDVPLDLSHGTDFQIKVWQTLCQIPYGTTIRYKQLAEKIGKPTAFRACANANGKNWISLIVPLFQSSGRASSLPFHDKILYVPFSLRPRHKLLKRSRLWLSPT